MKVLIVEDERMLLIALESEFTRRRWEVLSAEDGARALEIIRTHPRVDIIVLDLVLPKVDGFEILRILKDYPQWKTIPVVVLTNLSDEQTIAAIVASGGTDFMVKSDYTLKETVNKVVEVAQRPPLKNSKSKI